LGESGLPAGNTQFAALLADDSPRVRAFAAIAAGKMKSAASISFIWEMLRGNDDPYLRHAGAYALSLLCEPQQISVLAGEDDPALRLAGVIALRRLKDPAAAAFLEDEDP